jgi:hypothetical protein
MTKPTKAQLAEIEGSRVALATLLNPHNLSKVTYEARRASGDATGLPTLYFVIESVSRSGMSRTMRVYVQATDDQGRPYMQWITGHVARVLGWRMARGWKDGVRVDGCGMDMCFHLVDCLLRAVFGYGPEALNANHYRRETL